jgi:hypothetical protein
MKDRLLLFVATLVVMAAGTWTTTRADEVVRGDRVDAVVAVARWDGRRVDALPAGVDRCCPHRPTRVGIVRVGGISGTPPGNAGPPPAIEPCAACDDWELCAAELESVGASMQVMPLRNGVMRVFTATTPVGVRVLQAALALHYERMSKLITTGAAVRLCPECRVMRGAAASGKLAREIIKTDSGCITLTTSADPAIVMKIHAETGIPPPVQPKL